MDNEIFWNLLKTIDRNALKAGDEDAALEDLVTALSMVCDQDIFVFDDCLSKALHDIDTKQHCINSGNSSESDDAFLYARCWVVAQGEITYRDILKNPQKVPKTVDEWCESLLYVAANAWSVRNDRDPSDYPHLPEIPIETGSNENGGLINILLNNAQQVDSAEASTIPVPPSGPSGSPR